MNENLVQVRVKPHHMERLNEIKAMTGLTEAQVIRELIEGATVEPRPKPVARIANRTGTVLADHMTGAIAAI